MLTLADVFKALTGSWLEAASLIISEAAIDSRQVIPAAMFVALPGERVDGHNYVDAAFERGAHIALVQKDLSSQFATVDLRSGALAHDFTPPQPPFCILVNDSLKAMQTIAAYWRQKLDVRVIGITGSIGKSTTKELTAEVLSQRYHTLKNMGNLNNEIGLPITLLRLGRGHERAIIEMGFYVPGEISFLCDMAKPSVGVITNVGTVHAERAGSQEDIARGKAELVQALPAAPNGWAVLNYDDPWVRPMADLTKASVFYYGLDSNAHLWADEITSMGLSGIHFTLHYGRESMSVRVPMIGQHSVHTVLRAAAVGLIEGLSWPEIIRGLQMGHAQLRLVATHTANGALILDDTYNASPESTLAALNLLNDLPGRHVAVLGDMLELGRYEKQGHELVGVRAAEVAQVLVAVGELGKMIADAALQSGLPPRSIHWAANVTEAVDLLSGILKPEDVVLIKGSHGLHMERIVAALEVEA